MQPSWVSVSASLFPLVFSLSKKKQHNKKNSQNPNGSWSKTSLSAFLISKNVRICLILQRKPHKNRGKPVEITQVFPGKCCVPFSVWHWLRRNAANGRGCRRRRQPFWAPKRGSAVVFELLRFYIQVSGWKKSTRSTRKLGKFGNARE